MIVSPMPESNLVLIWLFYPVWYFMSPHTPGPTRTSGND